VSLDLVIADRYVVLRRLGAGGMAEVFLARHRGHEGFERLVVVKRAREQRSDDAELRALFLDEARHAADLRHPNIVAVQDFGEHDGRFFLVMEFLHGQDVAHLAARLSERRQGLPLVHALEIVMGLGAGLHAAHVKTTLDGEPLELVHRDVSPQNAFVTYDGEVKLLDFGIARARGRDAHTEQGFIRGKHGYFAPEQLDGDRVDHRADQFALGIVLYELTTGHPLFRRATVADSLFALVNRDVPPPSALVDGYPDALERIVLRALAYDPAHRFASCQEFVDAIDDFVVEAGLSPSPRRLARFLRALFADKLEDDRSLGRSSHADDVGPPPPRVSDSDPLADTEALAPFRFGNIVDEHTPPPLIGRTAHLDRVAALLQGGVPVVSLVGGRSSGKSDLARHVAQRWLAPRATCFIDGARIETPEHLIRRISEAFGDVLPSSLPLPGLLERTRARLEKLPVGDGKRPLIVIDDLLAANELPFRRALDALVAYDHARVLVTTRGESGPGETVRVDRVDDDDGVRAVFMSGVSRGGASPDVASEPEVDSLLPIARAHPLSLTLLGGALSLVSARELHARMQAATREAPDLDDVDRVVDVCIALLDRDARRALALLAHARADLPFRLVERVLPVVIDEEPERVIEALTRASLVSLTPSPDDEGDVLVELPARVADRARASAGAVDVDDETVRSAFVALEDRATVLARTVDGPGGGAALLRLRRLAPILRAAIARALSTDDDVVVVRGVHAALALDAVYSVDGFPPDHADALESLAVRARALAAPTLPLAELAEARGDALRSTGARDLAHAAYVEAATLAERAGARAFAAVAERNAADIDRLEGRLFDARRRLSRALVVLEDLGERPLEARVLLSLAWVDKDEMHTASARQNAVRALDIFRHVGDRRFEGRALLTLATLDADVDRADRLFRRAIAIHDETGERHLEARARLLYADALTRWGRAGDADAERARATDLVDGAPTPFIVTSGKAPSIPA